MKRVLSLALGVLLTGWVGGTLAADKAKTMVAQGKVTAATNESLTIEDGIQDPHVRGGRVDEAGRERPEHDDARKEGQG